MSTGPSGVAVTYFNFTNGDWNAMQSSGPLAQVQNYSAMAANAASHVYAFQDGTVKEHQLAPGMAYFGAVSSHILSLPESQDMSSILDGAHRTFLVIFLVL